MAPVPKHTKFHFTHPNHSLVFQADDRDYICDGCKTSGSGSRFRCHSCNFDLHEYCSDCPEKQLSFIHQHHLTLVLRKQNGPRLNERICDICRDPVDGLFYRCKDCDYDAHPLCTQLPNELRHAADSIHSLKLQKPPFGSCLVCKNDCSSLWVYGCDICRINIHFHCIFEPYDSMKTQYRGPPVPPMSQERSGSTSRGIPFGPPPFPSGGGFQWYGGYPAYGNYGGYGYEAPYEFPNYGWGYNQNVNAGSGPGPGSSSSSVGKPGKSMFALVGRLTVGVMSSVIFGFPMGF